jgi:hypothetical protein
MISQRNGRRASRVPRPSLLNRLVRRLSSRKPKLSAGTRRQVNQGARYRTGYDIRVTAGSRSLGLRRRSPRSASPRRQGLALRRLCQGSPPSNPHETGRRAGATSGGHIQQPAGQRRRRRGSGPWQPKLPLNPASRSALATRKASTGHTFPQGLVRSTDGFRSRTQSLPGHEYVHLRASCRPALHRESEEVQ